MGNPKSSLFTALAALAAMPLISAHAAAAEPVAASDDSVPAVDEAAEAAVDSGTAVDSGAENQAAARLYHRKRVLSGKYGWTTQQVCARTLPNPPGVQQVDPKTLQLNVPAEIVSMAGVGTATFRPDGTLHIDENSTADSIQHSKINPGDTPLTNGFAPACDGTYSIARNGRATVDWNCKIKTPQPGLVIDGRPINWDGWVVDDGRTVDLNLKGTLQTLTFENNGTPVAAVNRLCIQRFVLHKLPQ